MRVWFARCWKRLWGRSPSRKGRAVLEVLPGKDVDSQPKLEEEVEAKPPAFELAQGPWELGGHPSCADPDTVRTELSRELYAICDRHNNQADREFIERLIRVIGTEKLDFPPFPDVARRLDRLLSRPDPSMFQVVKLVEQDPALLRRVWLQASSVNFSMPPSGLHHAIARIGFDALWRIGMTVCLHSAVFRVRGYQQEADHARVHGIVAAELGAWISGDKRGELYLAGLLHDVGKLLVYRAASVREAKDRPTPGLVHRLSAQFHPAIGLLAVHAWQLADTVAGGVGFHHAPELAPVEARVVAETLWLADVAAHTAEQARAGRECGGLAAIESVESLSVAPAALIEKAHSLLAQREESQAAAEG